EQYKFNVLYHSRDFPPGYPIIESIVQAIKNSKRIIFVVTKKFCESFWCREEINIAFNHVKKRRRLLVTFLNGV
ncbi:hypothetical protein HELRODRAFT_126798, partial [Helobdella robusta]|uniref:TIR domain-containing protein n=1 Tax=Helobdella robusta TaxID=6412 RepID=T1EHB0_HELRO